MSSHQRCAPGIVQRTTNRSSGGRNRIILGRNQVVVVQPAGSNDARAHATPEQHTFVRRLPTAAWIERGPIQDDPAVCVRGYHDRVPLPDRRVVEIQPMGVCVVPPVTPAPRSPARDTSWAKPLGQPATSVPGFRVRWDTNVGRLRVGFGHHCRIGKPAVQGRVASSPGRGSPRPHVGARYRRMDSRPPRCGESIRLLA